MPTETPAKGARGVQQFDSLADGAGTTAARQPKRPIGSVRRSPVSRPFHYLPSTFSLPSIDLSLPLRRPFHCFPSTFPLPFVDLSLPFHCPLAAAAVEPCRGTPRKPCGGAGATSASHRSISARCLVSAVDPTRPHPFGSPPNCLDKGLQVRTWRLRGIHANSRPLSRHF